MFELYNLLLLYDRMLFKKLYRDICFLQCIIHSKKLISTRFRAMHGCITPKILDKILDPIKSFHYLVTDMLIINNKILEFSLQTIFTKNFCLLK